MMPISAAKHWACEALPCRIRGRQSCLVLLKKPDVIYYAERSVILQKKNYQDTETKIRKVSLNLNLQRK